MIMRHSGRSEEPGGLGGTTSAPPAARVPRDARDDSGRYSPIADYGVIGDTRAAALIARNGSMDWLCWPRHDSRSLFAALLDAERGGCFRITPGAKFTSKRCYVDETNVLATTFEVDGGVARLTDLMPVMREEEKTRRLTPFRQLLRRIECIEGEVPIEVLYQPRPNYARARIKLSPRFDTICCEQGPTVMHLRTDVKMRLDDGTATASLKMRAGERHDFALSFDDHAPAVFSHIGDEASEEIERTLAFWREWSSQLQYKGEYRQHVLRSALVLKLLTYAPSGAIVAAPTTSLPEWIGSVRNWDYRYCWLRDASFTVSALYDCGFNVEGAAFVDWLLYATRLTQPSLQILYDVFGESRLRESTLDHFEGYRHSAPVRIGNGAADQFQLDVYAEVLGAVEEYTNRGETLNRDVRGLVRRLADIVAEKWREPDSGIWEKRSGRQQHVHGKVMAWSALDCAERLAKNGHIEADVDRWRADKDAIHKTVLEHGFNRKLNAFVAIFDGDELDASLLYVSRVGFLEPNDPRIISTIDAIRRALGRDDLVYRYNSGTTEDGLPSGEGAFLPCSFWLVEALALAGRMHEAHDLFQKLLRRCNDLGLLSEEADPESGALLGNFPQALTHIGLMSAALCLEKQGYRGR
jgi:GH15 family glucan-1,4-alpha-glucosidase